jgi:23S rRNA (cytidine1920-2'-O)/16S rRNA (cytidine1409-2'-O)-methyltransferase
MGARRARFVDVLQHVRAVRPDIVDPVKAIEERLLLVDGRIVTNPRTLVPASAAVTLRERRPLRGEEKLRFALDAFGVDVADRVCVDLGASAGGFTRVLLKRGAARVFAVDVGFGQLLGELRSDPRVVNLERTNLSDLRRAIPQDLQIDIVTMDLSYLSIADAAPQLETLRLAGGADLVAVVKPMFELGAASPPTDGRQLRRALRHAVEGVELDGRWQVVGTARSPVTGARGAQEWLLHARRTGDG